MKVVTVDNYQGEENDIIIVSLVRSNNANRIGYLKESNRVNVALSRAKIGMFVFGNASVIDEASNHLLDMADCREQKHIWNRVFEVLAKNKQVGEALVVKCQRHTAYNDIKKPSDFERVSEGGCDQMCKKQMDCGHICPKRCHPWKLNNGEPDHDLGYRCTRPCERKTKCGHGCMYHCYQCKERHQKCPIEIEPQLICGHKFYTVCHKFNPNEPPVCNKTCRRT